jgi:hypothetical protein
LFLTDGTNFFTVIDWTPLKHSEICQTLVRICF